MNFQEGDQVMHWTYGLGKVIRLEERALSGANILYYAVQVGELTVWVPADGMLETRLRHPTPKNQFKELHSILSGPNEPLPEDRQERKLRLIEMLKDGRAESLCRVVRDLSAYRLVRPLNDNDMAIMKRAQTALLAEWGFALSVTQQQAELELHRLLNSAVAGN